MNRDNNTFWKLVEKEHAKARNYCHKLIGNPEDGDDLYQDSLVTALKSFPKLKNIDAFKSWFYTIMINTYKNKRKSVWWQRVVPISNESRNLHSSDNISDLQTAQNRLEFAFKSVSPDEKSLIILYEIEGWSIKEISEMTGLKEVNVRVRLCRIRNKMREALINKMKSENLIEKKSYNI